MESVSPSQLVPSRSCFFANLFKEFSIKIHHVTTVEIFEHAITILYKNSEFILLLVRILNILSLPVQSPMTVLLPFTENVLINNN